MSSVQLRIENCGGFAIVSLGFRSNGQFRLTRIAFIGDALQLLQSGGVPSDFLFLTETIN